LENHLYKNLLDNYQRHNKAEIERKKSDNKKGFIDILLATKSDLQSIKKYQVSMCHKNCS
jgi:hypothetical protein